MCDTRRELLVQFLSVDADTSRAAKNAAKVMKKFLVMQEWIEGDE